MNTGTIYYRQKRPQITTKIISVSNRLKEKDRRLLQIGRLVHMADIEKQE